MTESLDLSNFSTEKKRPWLFVDFLSGNTEIEFENAVLEKSKSKKDFLVWNVTTSKELTFDKITSKKFRLSHYQIISDVPYTADEIIKRKFLCKSENQKIKIISELK